MNKLQSIEVDLQCWQPVPPCSVALVGESMQACTVSAPPAQPVVSVPVVAPVIQTKARLPWKKAALRLGVAAVTLLLTGVVLASPAKTGQAPNAKPGVNKETQMINPDLTESLAKAGTGTKAVTAAIEPAKGASAPAQAASTPAESVVQSKGQAEVIAQSTPDPGPVDRGALMLAAGAGAAAGSLAGVAGVAMARRPHATKKFPAHEVEKLDAPAQTSLEEEVTPIKPVAHGHPMARVPTEVPQRPQTLPLTGMAYAAPDEVVRMLQRTRPQWKFQPKAADFALTSRTGHNDDNQDYGIALEFSPPGQPKWTMSVISDGCGGHYGGRHSAYTAVNAALNEVLKGPVRSMDDTVQAAMAAARERVADVGTKWWQEKEFRCTLIVLLASQDRYVLSYIGDGGVDVRRANGHWERMLHAQKQEGTGWLTGSLGPAPYGQAQFCSLPRMPGDVLIAGSDGLYVDELTDPEQFWTWPLDVIHSGSEALGTMLDRFVDMCIDTHPQVFHDNTTAFVLTTPAATKAEPKAERLYAPRTEGNNLNQKRLQAYAQGKSPEQVGG